MKKIMAVIILAASLMIPLNAYAVGSSSLGVVFEDILWGGGIGILLGTASLAFVEHAGDHTDRIYQGAAVGVIAGLAFGLYEIHPTFTAYRNPVKNESVYGMGLRIPIK